MSHRRRTAIVALALFGASVAAAAAPAPVAAETTEWGQSRGWSLGIKYLVDGLGADASPDPAKPAIDDMGAGLVLTGGYTFTPRFHVRLTAGSARHGTAVSDLEVERSLGTIEAHYRFMPGRQVCPYVLGSLGGNEVKADQGVNHVKFSGGMAGIGAGLLVGLSRHVAMDLTARLDGVNWNKAEWSQETSGGTVKFEDPIEDSGGSARLELGFLWQF